MVCCSGGRAALADILKENCVLKNVLPSFWCWQSAWIQRQRIISSLCLCFLIVVSRRGQPRGRGGHAPSAIGCAINGTAFPPLTVAVLPVFYHVWWKATRTGLRAKSGCGVAKYRITVKMVVSAQSSYLCSHLHLPVTIITFLVERHVSSASKFP